MLICQSINICNPSALTNRCVAYLVQKKHKVVLFGHSTGSQDCVEYLLRMQTSHASNNKLTASILQAPVSDRQGLTIPESKRKEWLDLALQYIHDNKSDELMPRAAGKATGGAPITAYRFWSLISEGGDDDYFSSDLSDVRVKQIWSQVAAANIPVMILQGSRDVYIPDYVNRMALIERWRKAFSDAGGQHGVFEIVNDGDHTLSSAEAQANMWILVKPFLTRL